MIKTLSLLIIGNVILLILLERFYGKCGNCGRWLWESDIEHRFPRTKVDIRHFVRCPDCNRYEEQ
jgi:hypothetical protein